MIKPIRNKTQYKSYLRRAYTLMQMDLKAKSLESHELETLSILIEKYEKEQNLI
jgi:antitoxin component HigA of HigAB toxin-antitoxin module